MTFITVTGADGRRYWTVERAREDWNLDRDFKVVCVARYGEVARNWHVNKKEFDEEIEVMVLLNVDPAPYPHGSNIALLWNSHGDRE